MDSACESQNKRTRSAAEEGETTSLIESLPCEILLDVLARLPIFTLRNVKVVCRHWYKLAQDPDLVNMRLSRMFNNDPCLILHSDCPDKNQLYVVYLFNHHELAGMVKKFEVPMMTEFDVIGSCNGQLCLRDSGNKDVLRVYNPFICKYMELPKSIQMVNKCAVYGFGIHLAMNEYKVLKVTYTRSNSSMNLSSDVEVLTLGSPNWRNLGQIPHVLIGSYSAVLVNEKLHWVTWPCKTRQGRKLVSFDLADEQFREIPKPDNLPLPGHALVNLGGCLSAVVYSSYGSMEIWVMKEYNVKDSWIKEFNIRIHVPMGLEHGGMSSFRSSKFYRKSSSARVLCLLGNGEILLEYKCRALVSYNPKCGTFKNIGLLGMPNWFEAVVHVG